MLNKSTRLDIARLIDDRPGDGVFSMHPEAFTSPDVFELELSHVFEATWLFIGLDSEVAQPHDYVTRQIGRRSVILLRHSDGSLRCFLNSCRHRGTTLCPLAQGNRKIHVCRYHGWGYATDGRNVGVTFREDGEYPATFGSESHDLLPVNIANYRGFVFASLGANMPSLHEHLGEARFMLDLIADQAPGGLEFVPGSAHYTFAGNWKMQFENGLDAYHFPSTHAAFVNIIKRREPANSADPAASARAANDSPAAGTISFPHGHAMSWSIGAPGQDAASRPLSRDKTHLAAVRAHVGEARLNWMLRQRNLTIFPNLQVIDIQSMQLRTWLPVAVDKTRMTSHCLAPKGENAEARRYRIRQYEEFFNAGGLATADDNVMYELGQAGFRSNSTPPPHPYARGMGAAAADMTHFAALGLEHAACTYSTTGLVFGDETGIHSGYREWHRLLLQGGAFA